MAGKNSEKQRPLAQNKKASHDYNILETVEAGIVLTGTEIKSVREGRVTLKDGFAQIKNDEAWLENVHKKQIVQLGQKTSAKGVTLVPLKVYLKNGFAKVLIGVATGKHEYDKRETIKRRDQEREIQRTLKNFK